jgi:hypothetical protein
MVFEVFPKFQKTKIQRKKNKNVYDLRDKRLHKILY